MFLQPGLYGFAVVNFQVVQGQKHFASGIFCQPAHELDQALAVHVVAVEHKPHLALIGDGKDHVDSLLERPASRKRTIWRRWDSWTSWVRVRASVFSMHRL
jgi:hypothetical protein